MSKYMLVKLPEYIYDAWTEAAKDEEPRIIGYIDIATDGRSQSRVVVENAEPGAPSEVPLKSKPQPPFPMLVFTENPATESAAMDDSIVPTEAPNTYTLQQPVTATADAMPRLTSDYLAFKRAREERRAAERDARTVALSDDYTPLKLNLAELGQMQARSRKEAQQVDKKVRAEEHEVVAILHHLYKQKTHYSMKELLELTQQPKQHLQSILNTHCRFHDRGELINTYSLRDKNTVTL